jgi:hypothetical protein
MERRTLQGIRARADPPFRSRSGPNQGATVSMPVPYPLQLELHADLHITRWRPLVKWLLATPHLMIACPALPTAGPDPDQLLHRAVHRADTAAAVRRHRHDLSL